MRPPPHHQHHRHHASGHGDGERVDLEGDQDGQGGEGDELGAVGEPPGPPDRQGPVVAGHAARARAPTRTRGCQRCSSSVHSSPARTRTGTRPPPWRAPGRRPHDAPLSPATRDALGDQDLGHEGPLPGVEVLVPAGTRPATAATARPATGPPRTATRPADCGRRPRPGPPSPPGGPARARVRALTTASPPPRRPRPDGRWCRRRGRSAPPSGTGGRRRSSRTPIPDRPGGGAAAHRSGTGLVGS